MASVVPLPGTNPNCMLSIFTILRMEESSTRSSNFDHHLVIELETTVVASI